VQVPASARRSPGRLEQDVYAAVAAAGSAGTTVADVITTVDPHLAYTTVVTTLVRLTDRGVLARSRSGRTSVYSVIGDSDAVVATSTARRMHRLLAATPDRPGVLAQFVAGLSADDEQRLTRLLTEAGDAAAPGTPRSRPDTDRG